MGPLVPLVDRPPDAVMFRLPGREVTAGRFAAAATRIAALLPGAASPDAGGGTAINLCTGRYAFVLAFAAAVARGHVSVLTSDRSPSRLDALAAQFPGSYTIDDADVAAWDDAQPDADCVTVPEIPAGQLAAIVYTSGSTGEPVGHRKAWGALAQRSRDAAAAFSLDAARPASLVGTVPPQHMYGFETTVLWPLHAPLSVWCGPVFFPADTREALSACPPPHLLVTTPLQLRGLLEGSALPGLARVISATAPLDRTLAVAAERACGGEAWEIFGATEVGSIAARRAVADPVWTLYPNVRLREVADGVVVEAPWCEPTALDDAVALDGERRFTLLGRRSDTVKVGGRRASLAGLNSALLGIDGVEDGVFVPPGGADHEAGRMAAFVVAPGRSAADIMSDLRGRIDAAFLPRSIVRVDRLPRNDVGKLPSEALRALRATS